MLFSEKLIYLQQIANVSNKELAAALSVDPSFVSRMRNQRKKPPNNIRHIKNMSECFAKKCTTDYQLSALAEIMGDAHIKLITKNDSLERLIYEWLFNGTKSSADNIGRFLQDMELVSSEAVAKTLFPLIERQNHKINPANAFFGNSGKREAIRILLDYLLKADLRCCINVVTDESLEWITESPSYSLELDASLKALTSAGYSFRRIAPQFQNSSEAIDALARWLPTYMQGKMDSYYYPRTRDGVYHRSLFVVQNVIAVSSLSVGYHSDCYMTVLHTDTDVVNNLYREYTDYLDKCIPMTIVHTHMTEESTLCDCFLQYLKIPGSRMSKYRGLPALTTPPSLLENILKNNSSSEEPFNEMLKLFEESLTKYSRTEVISLATLEELRARKVLCAASRLVPNCTERYYTPEEYVQHLEHLLVYLSKYPDYSVTVIDDKSIRSSLGAVEGGVCYIMQPTPTFTLFEIVEPNFVASVGDYILNLSKTTKGMRNFQKNRTIERIKELIAEIRENEKTGSPR